MVLVRSRSNKGRPQRNRPTRPLALEVLEDRSVPSITPITVSTLNDSGSGSLRQAILQANAQPGADTINFSVAGTIRLTSGSLPTITGTVDIKGGTAPGFTGAPVVEVDFNHFGGLQLTSGAGLSTLRSLSLVNAAGAGITANGAGYLTITGNYIGLALDGTTVAGNSGNGLALVNSPHDTIGGAAAQDRNVISGNLRNGISLYASSNNQIVGNYIGTDATGTLSLGNGGNGILVQHSQNNLIGQLASVTGVSYSNTDSIGGSLPVAGWQGIRAASTSGQYLITGTSANDGVVTGLLYQGPIDGSGGTTYAVNVPGASSTSVYGPNNLGEGAIQLVGSYQNSSLSAGENGFLYDGTISDLAAGSGGTYVTVDYPGASNTIVHSTMGGLAVGNYVIPNNPTGHAFIYDTTQHQFITNVVFPGSKSNTAYGIWYNGGTSYTICGGYSFDAVNNAAHQDRPIGQAFLVDYDSATHQFSHWTSFSYSSGVNFVTHFEGISSTESGVYTLGADSVQAGSSNPGQGSWVTVCRNADGSFGPAQWVNLNYQHLDHTTNMTNGNSVYGNQVVGIVSGSNDFPYQATVNTNGFQVSNVISGNGANGIAFVGANNNQAAMNNIGTDVTGTVALGNGQNGVLITAGSRSNLIGGEDTGGNDPTNDVFVRPPQGNLISANTGNGVLINAGASWNQLRGNFIGTTATGNAALGNKLDGVDILNANSNELIGCTFTQNPFVFYNVISGNDGNGLQVTNSNNTTIQANFFGMGANNDTALGNHLNGVLIDGTSSQTTMGGPIPLGNVTAANGQNGIAVIDQASYFISYNTFCGLAAFSTNRTFGNGQDGMLITSSGSGILLRTNVITRNGANGVEIGGNAQGVRVAGNIIGLDTEGFTPMGNLANGVLVDGKAANILIGGPQPTFNIIPQNAISANGGNGVAIAGRAHNVTVNYSDIGTNILGLYALGNTRDGVYVGPGTYGTTIGSTDPNLPTIISGNSGNGIELNGTHGNTVVGSLIGTDAGGTNPLPNTGNGISINNSWGNLIGSVNGVAGMSSNLIANNGRNGVFVQSGYSNGILANSIVNNTLLGIALTAGANQNQAAPVLTTVTQTALALQVTGTLQSTPNRTFTIQFFANSTNGSSGQFYLGSLKVTTNGAGVATFTFHGPKPPAGDSYITATATDGNNNTSEFSAAVS